MAKSQAMTGGPAFREPSAVSRAASQLADLSEMDSTRIVRSDEDMLVDVPLGKDPITYVWGEMGYLAGHGQWGAMPYALLYEAVKSAGFAAGRSGHRLPLGLRRRLSLHQRYWLTYDGQ